MLPFFYYLYETKEMTIVICVTTTSDNQSLKIVPRLDTDNPTLTLTDKTKRKDVSVSVAKTDEGDYMVLTGAFSLTEGSQYTFRVKSGSKEIYRGLIFCTNQTDLDNYSINKDEYTLNQDYDNEFIVL
jgi:predicted small secreted protein